MQSIVETIDIPTLKDCITDKVLQDDENERARQRVFKILMDQCGFNKDELLPRQIVKFQEKKGLAIIDTAVFVDNRCSMILRYGLSSIVTRHRSALAAARIYTKKHLPYVVVTNGEDADVLDGKSGKVLFRGLDKIPSRDHLKSISNESFPCVPENQILMEYKVLYTFDVL